METYNLIIAGTIGSVITLFLTAIFDYFKEVYRSKKSYFKENLRWQRMLYPGFRKALTAIE